MQNGVISDQTQSHLSPLEVRDTRYTIASVQRAVDLLGAFLESPNQFSLTELSRMVGQTKNQTFRLLQTLADESMVVMDAGTKKYSLGYRLLELGVVAQKGSPLVIAVSPVLDRLVQELGETIVLTALVDDMTAICIDKRESSQALQISARVGRRIPLHAGAGSKGLLAFSSADFVDRFLERASPLPAFTDKTCIDPADLRKELATIRDRGYSISDEDLDEGACSVAALVRDHTGDIVAAMSIASPKTRFTPKDIERNSRAVMAAAEEASNYARSYR